MSYQLVEFQILNHIHILNSHFKFSNFSITIQLSCAHIYCKEKYRFPMLIVAIEEIKKL